MVLKKAQHATKQAANKVLDDNERGARKALLEELFNDFNRSRAEVYRMNFMRGVFFAVGSIIGGSIVIVIVIWLLNLLVDLPGGIGGFIQSILDAMESRQG